jgi:hypothetical protein
MDATYATNPYRMPLVIFSSVNNEGRNTIIAFGLLSNETMESYIWLLKQLKSCGVIPKVLLTDFDSSMAGAIEQVLPETTHLLC